MKIVLKVILGLFLLVVLVVGGAAAMLLTMDPNSYKSQIAAEVKEATGRDFSIAGNIEVLFYPVLGFKVAGVEMGNPAGFSEKDFLKVGELQAGVKVIPLLSKKIEVTTVRLVEPQITVVKNKDGKTNLEFENKGAAASETTANSGSQKLDISFEGIEVRNAAVTYTDKATGKTTKISSLDLKMPGLAKGRDMDVSLGMVLNNPAPAKPITFDISATMKQDDEQVSFRHLKSNIDLGGEKATVTADVSIDTKAQIATIKDLNTSWQGTSLKGQATVKDFAKPSVIFDLSSPSVDLDALMPKKAAQPGDKDKALLPVDMLRTLSAQGKIQIGALKMSGLSFSDIAVNVSGENGVLTADPLTLKLYDGSLTSTVRIDARNAIPAFALKGQMKNLEVGKFLTAKMGEDYVTGQANIAFDLSSRGNTMNALNRAAGGLVDFDFGKGYINKWQLSKLLNQAITYFETGTLDPNASDKVYFTSLDGRFAGQNGVFSNDNLVLIGPKSYALGSGAVNLAAQSVDYTVRVGGGDNPEKFAKKAHVPVRIQGPFSKPSYSIDMQALLQDRVGTKIQEKIEEKKQDLMEGLFKKLDKKTKVAEPAPAAVAPSAGEVAPVTPAPEAAAPAVEAVPVESAPAAVEAPAAAPAADAVAPETPAAAPVEAGAEAGEAVAPAEATPAETP